MSECAECGCGLEARGYHVCIASVPGWFHSIDCADKAHRRHRAEQRLVLMYGEAEAARIQRTARGETDKAA